MEVNVLRQGSPQARLVRSIRSRGEKPVVFTAVEGTLVDLDTFKGRASRAMSKRLKEHGVPTVLVSAMTLGEIEQIDGLSTLCDAMIVEAGGAIARHRNDAWELEPCGPSAEQALDAIAEIEAMSGADLIVYSVLSEDEAGRLSGRSGSLLRSSLRRSFSEPFVIERGSLAAVARAASSLGYAVLRDRKLLYLMSLSEPVAYARLRSEFECDLAIGLGGYPIDATFLSRTDIAVIVPAKDGSPDPTLASTIPGALVAPESGSSGWSASIRALWPVLRPSGNKRERR